MGQRYCVRTGLKTLDDGNPFFIITRFLSAQWILLHFYRCHILNSYIIRFYSWIFLMFSTIILSEAFSLFNEFTIDAQEFFTHITQFRQQAIATYYIRPFIHYTLNVRFFYNIELQESGTNFVPGSLIFLFILITDNVNIILNFKVITN